MDLLTDALHGFGMTGVFYASSELSAPWGVEMPPMPATLVFHLITSGSAVVEVEGTVTTLRPGQVVLVPHGTGHTILDRPGSQPVPLFDLPREEVTDRYERVRLPGAGPRTDLICGAVNFTGLSAARLVRALPPVLVVDRSDEESSAAALALIASESRTPRPGSDVVTARLADVLVVQAVRSWLESDAPGRGWVAAIRDDAIGRALSAFHAEPSKPWGLDALARAAGLSRSAFCARFTHLMGEPPITYTTSWRMDLAARLVLDGMPLARVAERVSYSSEAAFNRAFKRAHRVTPGVFARRGVTAVALSEDVIRTEQGNTLSV